MSGILGLWNLDGAPVPRELLQRLAATLQHRGPDATGFWVDGPVGMAACLLRVAPESLTEVQPAVRPSEAVCVFDGRLDNRDEILDVARGLPPRGADVKSALHDAPDSALVLAAYSRYGEKFVERLNGDFAFAVYDMRRRQLTLARDYLGIRPLYYARSGDTFLFASEIKAILAFPDFPRVPNEDALAIFLAQGISQDERGQTLFSGVFNLPPAHVLTVTPGKTVAARHWSFENIREHPAKSAGDYAEGFRWHFERAVRRRIRSAYPVAVSVSGGLDSSSVFSMAETLRRNSPSSIPPILGLTLTYPQTSPADELQFIAALERHFGVAIARIPAAPVRDGSLPTLRQGIWHADIPVLDAQWDEAQILYNAVRQTGSRVLLTGHWGDLVTSESSHLVDLFNRFQFAALWARLREFPRWTTDFVPGLHTHQFWEDLLRYQKRRLPQFVVRALRRLRARHHLPALYSDALRRCAQRAEWQKSPDHSSFPTFHAQTLSNRMASRYFLSVSEEQNKVTAMHHIEIAFPLADRDVVCFVLAAPAEAYSLGAVPRGMLRQGLRGVVPGEILDRRFKADFTNYVNESATALFDSIMSELGGASCVAQRGYIDRDGFRRELERLHAQARLDALTITAAMHLQRLYRLELWLRIFFGDEVKHHGEVSSCARLSAS